MTLEDLKKIMSHIDNAGENALVARLLASRRRVQAQRQVERRGGDPERFVVGWSMFDWICPPVANSP